MMNKSLLYTIIVFVGINLLVMGRYFGFSNNGTSDRQIKLLFVSEDYEGYLEQTSASDNNPDILYWRILSHIFDADLDQAKRELSKLNFSDFSATTLNLFQILNKLERDDMSGVLQYIDNQIISYNLRERSATNLLNTIALLRQPNLDKNKLRNIGEEIRRTSSASRLSQLLYAAMLSGVGQYNTSFQQFEDLDNLESITEPLFLKYRGIAAFHTKQYDQVLTIFDSIDLSNEDKNQKYFAIDAESLLPYKYQSLYYEGKFNASLDIVNLMIENNSVGDKIGDTWIWKSRNEVELGLEQESRDSLLKALTYIEGYYRAIYDMINHHKVYPDTQHLRFVQRYLDKYIDDIQPDRILQLSNLRRDQGQTSESERLLRFLLAKFPDYEPALVLERGKVIEQYVTYRLAGDSRLDAVELELFEEYAGDRDASILLGTQKLAQGSDVEALRYFQTADSDITQEQMTMYLLVFYGFFSQIEAWDVVDAIDRDDEGWTLSELNQKLLRRWLAYRTGLEDVQSQMQFQIEALRGEDEPLDDDELEALFARAFAPYRGYWDKYFGEEEEEEIEE